MNMPAGTRWQNSYRNIVSAAWPHPESTDVANHAGAAVTLLGTLREKHVTSMGLIGSDYV